MTRLALGLALVLASAVAPPVARASAQARCVSSVGPGLPPPASVSAGIAGFHAAWYGQSGYPSLCPGDRADAVVAYYNSGSLGWVAGRMGEAAYLGTWGPEPGQDRPSALGGDGTRGSPATGWPRYDRVAVQPAPYIGPGQVAWFQFTIQAPRVPGTYRLGLRPLVEGATWLEDYGVFWVVTVLEPDGGVPRAAGPPGSTPIAYRDLSLSSGTFQGTSLVDASLRLAASGLSSGSYLDPHTGRALPYVAGSWTSEWAHTPFGFSELVASWNADTPSGTWIEIAVQTTPDGVRETGWYVLGRWAYGDGDVARTSLRGQRDDDARVATDTLVTEGRTMRGYRVRVTLHRLVSASATPAVSAVGVVASDTRSVPAIPSPAGSGRGVELAVPRYSQEVHAGEYPEYAGGGEAWCSPTATTMVVEFWGRGPSADDLSVVDPRYADRQVDHAARYTYDHAYRGTGNWPFNAAYAARFGLRASITRLRSLSEGELFVAAGIPLVASISVAPLSLPGFLFPQGTAGHLLVIVGFTAEGDVIANDPAAPSNGAVRRVYARAAFERAWLGGSGGLVYVIRPSSVALPAVPTGHSANW